MSDDGESGVAAMVVLVVSVGVMWASLCFGIRAQFGDGWAMIAFGAPSVPIGVHFLRLMMGKQ